MLKNKNFFFLLYGQSIANIGDTMYIIAVISSVYTLTHSIVASSLVPTIITGAMVGASFVSPLVTSKVRLNRILLITQAIKAVVLVALIFYIQSGWIVKNIFGLYLIISIIAFMDGFAQPVSQAILPRYAAGSELIKANSILNISFQLLGIGGWAGGSILLVWFSTKTILLISTVLAIGSILLLCQLDATSMRHQSNKSNVWYDLLSGWKAIYHVPILKFTAIISILDTVANSVWISSIILAFVEKTLKIPKYWWGYINATYMLGGVIGGFVCYQLSQQIQKNMARSIFFGALLTGIVTFLVAINSNPFWLLGLSILVGVFGELKDVPQTSMIQSHTNKYILPSVYSSLTVLYTGTFSLSSVVFGMLAQQFGVRAVFIISSSLLVIISTLVYSRRNLYQI